MFKKYLLSVIIVFIVLAIIDWLINYFVLMGLYEQTQNLWRPTEEIKFGLAYIVFFLSILFFNYLYYRLVKDKSILNGGYYGLIVGIMWGLSWGYGTYSYMPIPYLLALAWFLISIVEFTIGGLILGLLVREKQT